MTDKLYIRTPYPAFPGSEKVFFDSELSKIERALDQIPSLISSNSVGGSGTDQSTLDTVLKLVEDTETNKKLVLDLQVANDVASARIQEIWTVSVSNTSALVSKVTKLNADFKESSASIVEILEAQATETTARATAIQTLNATIGDLTATVENNRVAQVDGDTAIATQISSIIAAANAGTSASVSSEASARASADAVLASRIDTVNATITANNNTLTARITTEETARANADSAMASQITNIQALVSTNSATLQANITAEATARAIADSATASTINTVSASASRQRTFFQSTAPTAGGIGDIWYHSNNNNKPYFWNGNNWLPADDQQIGPVSAAVTNETYARVSADSALSGQISALASTVNTVDASLQANINSVASTQVSDKNALSSRIDSLTATVTTNNNNASTAINSEATARANGDAANSNAISAQASRVDSLQSTVTTNNNNLSAAISSEASTRASADSTNANAISAQASRVDSLSSTVNGNTASISTLQSSINGLNARYTLTVNGNGSITGFDAAAGGGQSSFRVFADTFSVTDGSGNATVPFKVVGGQTFIKDAIIEKGAVTQAVAASNAGAPWYTHLSITVREGSPILLIGEANCVGIDDVAGVRLTLLNTGNDLVYREASHIRWIDGNGSPRTTRVPAVFIYVYTPSSAGTYTFRIQSSYMITATLTAIELNK